MKTYEGGVERLFKMIIQSYRIDIGLIIIISFFFVTL